MKKFLSFVAAVLLAVVTATGIHAEFRSSVNGNTSAQSTTTTLGNGETAHVTSDVNAFNNAGSDEKWILAVPNNNPEANVKLAGKEYDFALEVTYKNLTEEELNSGYTITIQNDAFVPGDTYEIVHYKEDGTEERLTAVVSADKTLTFELHGASPVTLRKISGSNGTDNTNKKPSTNTAAK